MGRGNDVAKQSKGRKVGRWTRKPAHQRYTAGRRWIRNKARSILRMMHRHPNYHCPGDASAEVQAMVASGRAR
jgi:hypothetical protein